MSKPQTIKFFWKGLAALSGQKHMIESFNVFSQKPCINTLSIFFEEVKSAMIRYQDSRDLIYQVIEGYHYGAEKHGETDYLSAPLEDIINAIGRHLIQLLLGNGIDEESDLHHLAHIMNNILMASEILIDR